MKVSPIHGDDVFLTILLDNYYIRCGSVNRRVIQNKIVAESKHTNVIKLYTWI